jgi:hypothetical protein
LGAFIGAGLHVKVWAPIFSDKKIRRGRTHKGPNLKTLVKERFPNLSRLVRIEGTFLFAFPFMISIIAGFEIRDKTVHIKNQRNTSMKYFCFQ